MHIFLRGLSGLVQAFIGAYLGALLLLLICVVLGKAATAGDLFSAKLFAYSFFGVLLLAWWVGPAGFLFGIFMMPRIRKWTNDESWPKGFVLGGLMGLLTAVCLHVVAADMPILPLTYVYFPLYCALWCAVYARFIARWTDHTAAKADDVA